MIHATFFTANDSEILNLANLEELMNLIVAYEHFPSFDFNAVSSLSLLILQKEAVILEKDNGNQIDDAEIFRCRDEFVEKAAECKYEEYDGLAYIWRNIYWEPVRNSSGLGIWSNLYQLLKICKRAIETDKKLFVLKEN